MDNSTAAIVLAVGTVLGTVIAGIGTLIINLWNNRSTAKSKERQDTLIEYKDLLDRQDKRIEALETGAREKEVQHIECQRGYERAQERIGYLEDALTTASIPFHKSKSGDTGKHPIATPIQAS